jgi:hypothetical protein
MKDHIAIVGGPGNSLDRNYNYPTEKDWSGGQEFLAADSEVPGSIPGTT